MTSTRIQLSNFQCSPTGTQEKPQPTTVW